MPLKKTLNYLREHPEAVGLIAILALSALLRLASLHAPFDRDEGQYATIAQVILRGGLPYRDAIEIKPPGTFYLYALAIYIFGATIEAVRTFTAVYALLTAVAVYLVSRQIAGSRAALGATLLYGVFSTVPQLQGISNTEVFLVLPMIAGVWCFLQALDTRKRRYLYGAGLCASLAMLIKPVALPVVALEFLLIPCFGSGPGRWKQAILDLAAFLAPVVACALATLCYFYLRGGLDDFLYWTVVVPRRYKDAEIFLVPPVSAVVRYLHTALLVPALLGIPAAFWLALTRRTIPGLLPLLLILAVSLAVTLPGKNHPHYFIMLIPFLAIPAGAGLVLITRLPRVPACLALAVVSGLFVFSLWENYRFYTVYTPEEAVTATYGSSIFVDSANLARYLKEHTSPQDYIFQWGFEPELYFLADRRCPNPYLVSLLPDWSDDPVQAINRMQQSLLDKKPAYLVLQPEWSNYGGIFEIREYIRKNCYEETKAGYAVIYRCSAK